MRKTLTAALVEKTQPPETGRVEISDTLIPQLALRVTSNGAKSYVVRTRVSSRQVRVTLGDARGMSLKDARAEASKALTKCRAGINPREERRQRALEAEKNEQLAVPLVIEDFLTRHASKNRTALETRRIFEHDVVPRWKNRLLTEITRADVVGILDAVEDRASPYRANRVLAAIRKMFNWSVSRGLIPTSPIVKDMARKGETPRERFLAPVEMRAVWNAASILGGPFGAAVKMLLITGQRRGEVASLTWHALDLTNERVWTLTAEDTKAKRNHIVPLSDLAIDVLTEQPMLGKFVFSTSGEKPISGFGKAKRDLDQLASTNLTFETIKQGVHSKSAPMIPWRLHDLRRTVATHMEDALGIPPHIIGAVLNHDPKSYKGITATYTRGSLLYERRRALVAWARFLELVIDSKTWATVEPLLSPETEADAARTDEFRRMIQGESSNWTAYLQMLDRHSSDKVVSLRS